MNRRRFLSLLGIAAAGAVAAEFDPERLLWVPGAKAIFLPPPRMNTFLTADIITQEALKVFESSLLRMNRIHAEFAEQFDRPKIRYDSRLDLVPVRTSFRSGLNYGVVG